MPNMMPGAIHTTLFNLHKNAEDIPILKLKRLIFREINLLSYCMIRLLELAFNWVVLWILYLICNAIIQRDAALNCYFKLFLNFYRNHLGVWMGYSWPQMTFKWSLQVHLVYSTLLLLAPLGMWQSSYRAFLEIQSLHNHRPRTAGSSSSDSHKDRKEAHFIVWL